MSKEDYAALKQSATFDLFFKKIDQLETRIAMQQRKHLLNREAMIDQHLGKSAGNFTLHVGGLQNIQPPKSPTKPQKILSPTFEYAEALSQLHHAVSQKDVTQTLLLLTDLQKKADKLIDKKKYLEVKQLSIEILQKLPVPQLSTPHFWQTVPGDQKINFSQQIAEINKHLWESSLRLQEEAPSQDQLLQMLKSQIIIADIGKTGLDQDDLYGTRTMYDVLPFKTRFLPFSLISVLDMSIQRWGSVT